MAWHSIPRDDAWKLVTFASVLAENRLPLLWVDCACGRTEFPAIHDFISRTGLAADTPFLAASIRLRCNRCGERKMYIRTAPHGFAKQAAREPPCATSIR